MNIEIEFKQILEDAKWYINMALEDERDLFIIFNGKEFRDEYWPYEEFTDFKLFGTSKEELLELCYKAGTPKTPEYKYFKPYCTFFYDLEESAKLEVCTPRVEENGDREGFIQVTQVLEQVGIKYSPPEKKAGFMMGEGERYY